MLGPYAGEALRIQITRLKPPSVQVQAQGGPREPAAPAVQVEPPKVVTHPLRGCMLFRI
jgi:hypothetical protein